MLSWVGLFLVVAYFASTIFVLCSTSRAQVWPAQHNMNIPRRGGKGDYFNWVFDCSPRSHLASSCIQATIWTEGEPAKEKATLGSDEVAEHRLGFERCRGPDPLWDERPDTSEALTGDRVVKKSRTTLAKSFVSTTPNTLPFKRVVKEPFQRDLTNSSRPDVAFLFYLDSRLSSPVPIAHSRCYE